MIAQTIYFIAGDFCDVNNIQKFGRCGALHVCAQIKTSPLVPDLATRHGVWKVGASAGFISGVPTMELTAHVIREF